MARVIQALTIILLGSLIVAGVKIGYDRYTESYTVSKDASGDAVAQVVAAKIYAANDLRVSQLRGTVQGVAVDLRFFELIKSRRVMKAPFKVSYFVDVGRLRPKDFRYDEQTRTLFVQAPPVRAEQPDIDETRISLDRTDGPFVTRGAMIVLQRTASQTADRVATEAANRPDNIAKARDNARKAIAALFEGSLRAARIDAKVEVRFADEPKTDGEQMDRSRSLQEVLGNLG